MNNDLISRSALVKDLELLAKYQPEHKQNTILGVCATVRAAPAVDAEPVRHGRWDSFGVRRTDAKGRNRIEYMFNACTLCENPAVKRTAYCPNCGAKMDAEVEG